MLRARFFDDWRLSRIDEEVERLSVNSDTSVAVDALSSPLHAEQRSASEERVAKSDDDDDEPPLPPPPSPLPLIASPQTKITEELDLEHLRRLDEETEALRFLQVKYDTLGKVKVEKRQTAFSQQAPVTTVGCDETVIFAGPQCRLSCDCALTSAGDERPKMTVNSTSPSQSSTSCQVSVTERRRPPPPPTTVRRECCCPSSNAPGPRAGGLQTVSADDYRHHLHHYHHQQQQQQVEQFAHQQRCSQTSVSMVRQQSQHQGGVDGSRQSSVALCSCPGDHQRRGGSTAQRRCFQMLSNAELFQIDLFYRSRKTHVHVCPCPAVLYFARAATVNSGKSSSWRSAAAGVPVIVADTVRAAAGPRLHVVLAERGTGFELWRCGFTDVQQYSVDETWTPGMTDDGRTAAAFHTVILPSGDRAGLAFDDAVSASEFHRQILRLGELYSTGTGSRSKKGKKTATRSETASDAAGGRSGRRPGGSKCRVVVSKADISQPCCFTHVTRLERGGAGASASRNSADISQRTAASGIERTQRIFSPQCS